MHYKIMKKIVGWYLIILGISGITSILSFSWMIYNISDFKDTSNLSPLNQIVEITFSWSFLSLCFLVSVGVISLVVGFVGNSLRKMKDK